MIRIDALFKHFLSTMDINVTYISPPIFRPDIHRRIEGQITHYAWQIGPFWHDTLDMWHNVTSTKTIPSLSKV